MNICVLIISHLIMFLFGIIFAEEIISRRIRRFMKRRDVFKELMKKEK